jgi:hypothetical protein
MSKRDSVATCDRVDYTKMTRSLDDIADDVYNAASEREVTALHREMFPAPARSIGHRVAELAFCRMVLAIALITPTPASIGTPQPAP